ncbi:dihydrolipoamide acetyltransferase [Nannocystaceae bacterium ST9]
MSRAGSRPWSLASLLALLSLLLALVIPIGSAFAGPPATGTAIPPKDLPQNKPAADPVPEPAPEPVPEPGGGGEELFKTTETPEGVDSSTRESEIYGARIDGMQSDVDDLKERIFRSKARLSVLKETVLHGVLAGSRVIIAHRNLMGSQFRLTKLAVVLDGAQIYARTDDSGALDQEDELVVLDGNIVPGPHTITVELTYAGQGFGVFSYLNGYTFESRSSHNFTAPENGALRLLSVGFEKGNLTTEMKDRPSVDWQEVALDASGKPLPQQKTKSKTKTKSKRDVKPSDKKAADPEPAGDDEPGKPATKPAESKPAPQKPTAQKPGASKPAESKPAESKPAPAKPVPAKPASGE